MADAPQPSSDTKESDKKMRERVDKLIAQAASESSGAITLGAKSLDYIVSAAFLPVVGLYVAQQFFRIIRRGVDDHVGRFLRRPVRRDVAAEELRDEGLKNEAAIAAWRRFRRGSNCGCGRAFARGRCIDAGARLRHAGLCCAWGEIRNRR